MGTIRFGNSNRENSFFLVKRIFGYIAVNGESPFFHGNRDNTVFFFSRNVTWTVIVSLPLRKLSGKRLKTRLRVET